MKPNKKELTYLINIVYNKLPPKYTKNLNPVVVNSIRELISKLLSENKYNVKAAYSELKKDLKL